MLPYFGAYEMFGGSELIDILKIEPSFVFFLTGEGGGAKCPPKYITSTFFCMLKHMLVSYVVRGSL